MSKQLIVDQATQVFQNKDLFLSSLYIGLQRYSTEQLLHRQSPFLGIEEFLYVRGKKEDERWRSKVCVQMLKSLQITAEEAWEQAARNTFAKGETVIRSLPEMLLDVSGIYAFEKSTHAPEMYVVTNAFGLYGASQILDKEALRSFLSSVDPSYQGLILLPSSIHEFILVLSEQDSLDIDSLHKMVQQVNESTVSEREQLADCCFAFSTKDILTRLF